MSYDSWKTTTPEDNEHNEDCICERCHEGHIESGQCARLATEFEYECCVERIEEMVHNGEWCAECNTDAYISHKICHNAHKDGECHKLLKAA